MRFRLSILVASLILTGTICAEEKVDASKIVGVWKAPKSTLVPDMQQEWVFSKDGTFTTSMKMTGMERKSSGTYKVDGNKLIVTNTKTEPAGGPKQATLLIKTLNDEKAVFIDGTDINDVTAAIELVRDRTAK